MTSQLVAGMYDHTIKVAEILGVDTDKVEVERNKKSS